VDAPCSGERHLLGNPKELVLWSESRSKKLAQRQYALLTAALLAIKSGGRIVYSTCSISPYENDGVITELKRRKGDSFRVQDVSNLEVGEKTEHGVQFLPDQIGWGPIYMCALVSN
jgi:16S rRNA C967 or C1407 C5-methylase (RsmB/RsmF family)